MALDVQHRDKNGENSGSTATHELCGVKKLALIAALLLAASPVSAQVAISNGQ
jgi:hypothetical protein